MSTWDEVQKAIQSGWNANRNIWPPCKTIRAYRESDADYIGTGFNTDGAIVCECDRPCDCKISVWVPEHGDKDADDWHILKV